MVPHSCLQSVVLILTFIIAACECQLCDGKQYAQNVYSKLMSSSSITEEYDITVGNMVWCPNQTMWAANPNGIYAIYEIPPWGTRETRWGIYLRAMDAIIFVGCTPPMARYYSWDSYLFYRYFNASTVSWPFASLSDALNHLVINTTNASNAFNSLATVITTADRQTFADINSVLQQTNDINLMPIPTEYFNFVPYGIDNPYFHRNLSYDTFMTLIRIAIPDTANAELFKEYISHNQTVIFLEKRNVSKGVRKPRISFDPIPLRNTFSDQNINETQMYLSDLLRYMTVLIDNLTMEYNLSLINNEYFGNNYDIYNISNYGYSCIEYDRECVGDDRDAQYWSVNITDLERNIYVILGVNSVSVNLSSAYQSFSYYNHGHTGSASLTNAEYNSSVIDLNVPNVKYNISEDSLSKFYVIQLGRPYNLEIIQNMPTIPITESNWSWVQPNGRDYLNAITKTRPDKHQMIPPILLTFQI